MCWFVKPSSPVLDFMTKVANDEKLRRAYAENPRSVVEAHYVGENNDERDALMTTDRAKILHSILGRHPGL